MGLIDADAMREDWLENGENEYVYDTNCILESIDEQPTIDAVPVVRCKDCKNNPGLKTKTKDMLWCRKWQKEVRKTDFCSYGERKEEA